MSKLHGTEGAHGGAAQPPDDPVEYVKSVLAGHTSDTVTTKELQYEGKELKRVIEQLTGVYDGVVMRCIRMQMSLSNHGEHCMKMLAAYAEGLEPTPDNQAHLLGLVLRVQRELLGNGLEEVQRRGSMSEPSSPPLWLAVRS